ncbi:AMP-binding protein [Paenibacillus aurantius]|uniref:AMP-binding protein n=1 Tax=Paenibacillus aurantius TaxID=2918900 RepID=A0AA96LBS1_9BACL|nr:AMP-binding protein [Paenibacillus aurantius]WNQ10365.1 AMP-binding protein [Paenibacillus aurantius]
MKAIRLLRVMAAIGLLTPRALLRLAAALLTHGVNLMTLLNFSARTYGERTALTDERETLTYDEWYRQSEQLSQELRARYGLGKGSKVGLMGKNHASLAKALFAVSSTGADLYLLNAEMSPRQLTDLLGSRELDLLIHDEEQEALIGLSSYRGSRLLNYHETLPAVNRLAAAASPMRTKSFKSSTGKLILLTGGTTGKAKEAPHRPSLFAYLAPFEALLSRLKLADRHTAYVATPLYHGYGLAVLLLFCALGKKVLLRRGFEAEAACRLIRDHQADAVSVVPLMLRRMLQADPEALKSLRCVASGGAELSPKLAEETRRRLGNVLYNLYGTSEAGLAVIATPQDLERSPGTIGRAMEGVGLTVLTDASTEAAPGAAGRLCVRSPRSGRRGEPRWIETGDWGWRDEEGRYFLSGRTDSMIVSGGENVYPFEVEQVLLAHPQVEDAAVAGMMDELYGQRLKAYVQLVPGGRLSAEELKEWLRSRLARYQQPKEIVFVRRLPYTPLGKLDRKRLTQQ